MKKNLNVILHSSAGYDPFTFSHKVYMDGDIQIKLPMTPVC